MRALTDPEFQIYSGDDQLTLPIMAVGGCGVICVASHVVGIEMKAMIEAYLAGDVAKAITINNKLMPLFKALACTTNPIPVKAALAAAGLPCGSLRPPLIEANEAERAQIAAALKVIRP